VETKHIAFNILYLFFASIHKTPATYFPQQLCANINRIKLEYFAADDCRFGCVCWLKQEHLQKQRELLMWHFNRFLRLMRWTNELIVGRKVIYLVIVLIYLVCVAWINWKVRTNHWIQKLSFSAPSNVSVCGLSGVNHGWLCVMSGSSLFVWP